MQTIPRRAITVTTWALDHAFWLVQRFERLGDQVAELGVV